MMKQVSALIGLVGLVAFACSGVQTASLVGLKISQVKTMVESESATLVEMSENWMKKADAEQGVDKAQLALVAHLIESIEYNRNILTQDLAYGNPGHYVSESALLGHYKRAYVSIDSQLSTLVKINEKLARQDLADDIVKIEKLAQKIQFS